MEDFISMFTTFLYNFSHTSIIFYTFTLIMCLTLFSIVYNMCKGSAIK